MEEMSDAESVYRGTFVLCGKREDVLQIKQVAHDSNEIVLGSKWIGIPFSTVYEDISNLRSSSYNVCVS